MNETYQKLFNEILEHNEQDWWNRFVWERTHGKDTQTKLLIQGDIYPESLLKEVYDEILIRSLPEVKSLFIGAIKFLLVKSLNKCQKFLEKQQSLSDNLKFELLAIERAFHIINHFQNIEDIKSSGTIHICNKIYIFIYRNKNELFWNEFYGSLRRVIILVCFRLNKNFISLDDLIRDLEFEETCVTAFRCLCRKEGLGAIGKYFPSFVSTSFNVNTKVFVYLELKRIKEDYFLRFSHIIESQLNIALEVIKENSQEQYEFVLKEASEFNLVFFVTTKDILTEAIYSCIPNNFKLAFELFDLLLAYYPDKSPQCINHILKLKIGFSCKLKFMEILCFRTRSPAVFVYNNHKNSVGSIYLEKSEDIKLFDLVARNSEEAFQLSIKLLDLKTKKINVNNVNQKFKKLPAFSNN